MARDRKGRAHPRLGGEHLLSASQWVVDADEATFESLVIEGSRRVPVLVDFWAEWCGPCRAIAPMLENLANEFGGRLMVVKVDTDREQALAGRFGIRSLPTVKLFKDGAVVDEFLGVQPESAVRALLERHVPRASDEARARARALVDAGDLESARSTLEQALSEDPGNHRIAPDLANLLIDLGDTGAARALLDSMPAGARLDADVQAARSRLEFVEAVSDSPSEETLVKAIEENPDDCESRYQLAALKVADGDLESALEQFLEILRADRGFREDAGRKGMLSVFELLGNDDPLVARYRSRMASLMY